MNRTRPLYIFDLDGTIALIEHRRHHVEKPNRNWTAFFAACVDDVPNLAVIRVIKDLSFSSDIWVWSGRSDEVRDITIDWLRRNVYPGFYSQLQMRKAGDYQPDVALKRSWLRVLSPEDRARLVAIFDDRSSVVAMWREEGIPCFQVAPGDF